VATITRGENIQQLMIEEKQIQEMAMECP